MPFVSITSAARAFLGSRCVGLVLAALFVVNVAAVRGFAQTANVAETEGEEFVEVTKDIATLSTESGVVKRVRRGKKLRLVRTQGEWLRVATDQGDKKEQWWVRKDQVQVLGDQHGESAKALFSSGQEHAKGGKYEQAKQLHLRALQMRLDKHGKKHRDTAASLHELGVLCRVLRDYKQAQSFLRDAFTVRYELFGQESLETAQSLDELAKVANDQGDYRFVLKALRGVLDVYRKTLGGDHHETARVLNDLGVVSNTLGYYPSAKEFHRQALAIRRKWFGEKHTTVILSLNNLTTVLSKLGEFTEALRHAEQAVAICREIYQNHHTDTAFSLSAWGYVLSDMGDHQQALERYKESLAVYLKTAGENHAETAMTYNNIGFARMWLGDFAAARGPLEKSLKIRRKRFGEIHPQTAESIINLGALFNFEGKFKAAEKSYAAALAILQKTVGDEHPHTLVCLNNLGQLLGRTGRYQQAHEILKTVVSLRSKVFGENHPETARARNNLGAVLAKMRRFNEAAEQHEKALLVQQKTLGDSHPELATTLMNLAYLHDVNRRFGRSLDYHRRAAKVLRAAFGDNHPMTMKSIASLGFAHAQLNDYREAAKQLDQARRAARIHAVRVLPALNEREQLTYLKENDEFVLHGGLSLAFARPDDQSLAQMSAAWLLNGKAIAHESLAQDILLSRQTDAPAASAMLKRLRSLRTQLANLSLKPVAPQQRREHERQIEALRSQEKNASSFLRQENLSLQSPQRWTELEDVRRQLDHNSVLIEFLKLDVVKFQANSRKEQWPGARYVAWIIPAAGRGRVRIVDLGPAEKIEELIEQVRNSVLAPARKSDQLQDIATLETSLQRQLDDLSRMILHPLLRHTGLARRLILSPDGSLWLTPWAALTLAQRRYAVEEYEIAYVVSGRDLALPSTHMSSVSSQPPIVLADPDYDALLPGTRSNDAQRGRKSSVETNDLRHAGIDVILPQFGQLKYARREAQEIGPNLKKYAGAEPRVLLGAEAREQSFMAVRGPKAVVLCTHGYFLSDQQVNLRDSGEARGASSRPSSSAETAVLTTEGKPLQNPLLRSGVVLAGCNRRGKSSSGGEDGVLTGLENVGADLRGTELVVLSACETGVGEVRNGEGVAGLRQAFQLAGAESVAASLWNVNDLETARLMRNFFHHLAQDKTKSAALRAAQLQHIKTLRDRTEAAHPFFWAAFTITGN